MQTPECQKARADIAAFLENIDQKHSQVEAAISHMSACSDCLRSANYLLKAVIVAEEDDLTCEDCQEQLPEYLFAQISGLPADPAWRAIELHLSVCARCAKIAAELAELSAFGDRTSGVEPPAYPKPELSFLRAESMVPQPVQARWWQQDQIGRLLITLSEDLLHILQPPASQFAFSAFPHKAGASPIPLWQIALDKELDDLAIRVLAVQMPDDLRHCMLAVDVNIPSRGGWPELAGSRVTLRRNDIELAMQETDAFGKTIFEGIAIADLPTLVIEVERVEIAED
jgi:hypothetical protein